MAGSGFACKQRHFSLANFCYSDQLREAACPDSNMTDISSVVKEEIEEGGADISTAIHQEAGVISGGAGVFSAPLNRPAHVSTPLRHHTRVTSGVRRTILHELGLRRCQAFNPRARHLFVVKKTLRRAIHRSSQKLDSYKERLKRASETFNTFSGRSGKTPKIFASFMENLIKLHGTKIRGHRFSFDDKLLSLQLMVRSGRAYKFLSKVFVLPTQRTLQRFLSRLSLHVGINENMFDYFKSILEYKRREKKFYKHVVLMFDEMNLCAHLNYDKVDDVIEGFHDLGEGRRSPRFADKALVFMIRGLVRKYKQPVAYYFTAGTLNSGDLAMLIKEVIAKLTECGFFVVATVCDQASSNCAAINKLCTETKESVLRCGGEYNGNYFFVQGSEIIPLFDPPHLLKGVRNALLKHDIEFQLRGISYKASWSHIQQVYHSDKGRYRVAPRLTTKHVEPHCINKMKVKLASQVFSYSVAKSVFVHIERGLLVPEAIGTAEFCRMIDLVFDSVNGTSLNPVDDKIYRCAVTNKSPHVALWNTAIEFFDSLCLVGVQEQHKRAPSFKNWSHTLRNIKSIWFKMQGQGFKFLSIRNLNQDPLEIKFGGIRSYGFRNNTPTCTHFTGAYKALILHNLVSSHSVSGNCEDDDCSILDNLHDFMSSTAPRTEHSSQGTTDHIPHQDVDDRNASTSHPDLGYVSRLTASFVAGYVLNKVGVNCVDCISKQHELVQNDDHELISHKEPSVRRRLNYPSRSFTEIFRRTDDLLAQLIPKYCHTFGIAQLLRTHVINEINFSGTACEVHIDLFKNKFISYMVDLSLKFWTTRINRYLVGKDNRLSENSDAIQLKAIEYYKMKMKK